MPILKGQCYEKSAAFYRIRSCIMPKQRTVKLFCICMTLRQRATIFKILFLIDRILLRHPCQFGWCPSSTLYRRHFTLVESIYANQSEYKFLFLPLKSCNVSQGNQSINLNKGKSYFIFPLLMLIDFPESQI